MAIYHHGGEEISTSDARNPYPAGSWAKLGKKWGQVMNPGPELGVWKNYRLVPTQPLPPWVSLGNLHPSLALKCLFCRKRLMR